MTAHTLTENDQSALLYAARETLQHYLRTGEFIDLPEPGSEALYQIHNVFVTLTKYEQLRGCIGNVNVQTPLYKSVAEYAIHAAINDHRFEPVEEDELSDIDIEISVLFPPYPVDSYKEIQLGKHGIVLKKNGKKALFLAQVAIEHEWDIETTLSYLSEKAGLTRDAWKSECEFLVFESLNFHE